MAIILERLYENVSPPLTISSPFKTPLQYVTQALVRHLSEWLYGVLVAEFSSHCKVSRSSSTKEVPPWLNVPVSHDLIFAPVEDIETGIVLVKWSGQLTTTGQLSSSDLRLKFFAVWKSPDKVTTHFFSLKEPNSFFLYLLLSPETQFFFTGWRTDFLRLITKPKCCNRKINLSLAMRITVTSSPLATYRLGI